MDEKKFTYRFSPQLGIFFKHYFGKIVIEDITSSWDYLIKNHFIPPETKGFVLDYRNAVMDIRTEQHTAIDNYYKNHLEVFKGLKIAILTENPQNVVITILVESKGEGYHSKPFSTMEAAIAWVLER